jgi:hypothetical protein
LPLCVDFPKVFIRFKARIQSKIDPFSSKIVSLIKIREFWVYFTTISFVLILILKWWLCNKLGFGDLVVFQNLETKKLVSIDLERNWPTFNKNPLRRLEMWTHKKD